MNKDNKEVNGKMAKLLVNRGFYILLALGLAIIGVSGYVSSNRKNYIPMQSSRAPEVQQPTFKDQTSMPTVIQKTEKIEVPKKEVPKKVVAAMAKPTDEKLMLPLQGELTANFSLENLVYSKTMQDWRIHSGIDISGDVGSQVKAAADGTVSAINNDEVMGVSIIIKHSGDLQTIYCNLQSNNILTVGQAVKKGDVIGGVGTSANYEIAEPPHLHFEVKKGDVLVNPFDFMAEQ